MSATSSGGDGVEVCAMSSLAPVPLFVLGRHVFYRPTGDEAQDAALVALGRAHVVPEKSTAPKP